MPIIFSFLFFLWLFLEASAVVISVMGNAIVLLVMSRDKNLKNKSSYYIISIAVTDFLFSLLVVWIVTIRSIKFWEPESSFPLSRLWLTSLYLLFTTVSILQIVFVSIDRFWAVCCPISYHKRTENYARRTIVFYWTVGTIFGLSLMMRDWRQKASSMYMLHFASLSILILASAFAIIVLYGLIFRAILKQVMIGNYIALPWVIINFNILGKKALRSSHNSTWLINFYQPARDSSSKNDVLCDRKLRHLLDSPNDKCCYESIS